MGAIRQMVLLLNCVILIALLTGCVGVDKTLPVTDLAADNVRRLNADIGFGHLIAWSPDSNMLFYKSGDWICAAKVDGTGTDKLVQVSSPDIFSLAEGKLLYTRTVPPQTGDEVVWQAYEMDMGNGQHRKIGELLLEDIADYHLDTWSPDGSKIFYTKTVDMLKEAFIWYLDAGESRYVCDLPREPEGLYIPGIEPSWSPDGKYITWFQFVNVESFGGKIVVERGEIMPGDIVILLIDIEKGECTELAQIDGLPYSHISWSPDSKRFMYAGYFLQPDTLSSLWTVDIHGNKQQITSMPDKHVYGFFGPDRGKITLISYDLACLRVLRNATFRGVTPENRTQISILDTDGTEEQRLLDIPCTEGLVIPEGWLWSNDGASLTFAWMAKGDPPYTDIYVLYVLSGS